MGATYAELIQARLVLEPQIARLAAERPDREALAPLKDFLVDDDEDIVIDAAYMKSDTGFHRVVCSLSGNPVLDMLATSLNKIVLVRLRGAVFSNEELRGILCDHQDIAGAILDGDGEKAEILMRKHMTTYIQGVVDAHQLAFEDVVDWT
jgi:DNA-binding FadR family transcriptional regulator